MNQSIVHLRRDNKFIYKARIDFINTSGDVSVGKSVTHVAAMKQVTGEALYVDDIPPQNGELYAALVFSQRAHAKIVSIDYSSALAAPGVVAVYDHRHVPGSNITGIFDDEEVFATNTVRFVGQIIAVVIAESQILAQDAAKLVKVIYEDLDSIVSIRVVFIISFSTRFK